MAIRVRIRVGLQEQNKTKLVSIRNEKTVQHNTRQNKKTIRQDKETRQDTPRETRHDRHTKT